MRKLVLSLLFGLVVMGFSWTPSSEARPWRGRGYYGYYYYAPAYSYTPGYTSYYTPGYTSYYTPSYSETYYPGGGYYYYGGRVWRGGWRR